MDARKFRANSVLRLSKAGLSVPAELPTIDNFSIRSQTKILDRVICLYVVVAVAYGFNRLKALAWLLREGVLETLTVDERLFLMSDVRQPNVFQVHVEGLWALAWLIGIVSNFDPWQACDSDFVTLFPDLKKDESSSDFRNRASLRSHREVGSEADLAYCLHWIVKEAEIGGDLPPEGIINYIVVERRRAFDWAIGDDAWNTVSLDT